MCNTGDSTPVARTGIKRGSGEMMKARGPEGDNQRYGLFMRGRTMGGTVDRIERGPRTVCSTVGSGVAVQKTKPISVFIISQPPPPYTHQKCVEELLPLGP